MAHGQEHQARGRDDDSPAGAREDVEQLHGPGPVLQAKVVANQAILVAAEATVPLAIAEAFKEGNIASLDPKSRDYEG